MTCACSVLGFERHSRAQCPILLQRRHSSLMDLFDDPPNKELSRPRPLPVPMQEWFSASCFYLRVFISSFVRYNFSSCCNDVEASSNASSASFSRTVRSTTDIVDMSSNVLLRS
jgi:hypothetical protein